MVEPSLFDKTIWVPTPLVLAHHHRPYRGGCAGVDGRRTSRLRAARPQRGAGWRLVGLIVGRPRNGACRCRGVTGTAVDDGSAGDVVRAVHTVGGAGWQVAVVFCDRAVISARRIDVALGYVVEDAPAARAAAAAGVTRGSLEAAAGGAVLGSVRSGSRGSGLPQVWPVFWLTRAWMAAMVGAEIEVPPKPDQVLGAPAQVAAPPRLGRVRPADRFEVAPNTVGGKHGNVGNIAHAVGGHAVNSLASGQRRSRLVGGFRIPLAVRLRDAIVTLVYARLAGSAIACASAGGAGNR